MARPWVKLWKQDLWGSNNFQRLSVFEKGIYSLLLTLCRDDEHIGKLCWPNGSAMETTDIVACMLPSMGDRTDRIVAAMKKIEGVGMLFRDESGILTIRKYREKTLGGSGNVAGR